MLNYYLIVEIEYVDYNNMKRDKVRFFKNLDLNVDKIYGGSDDAGIVIKTEPVYVRKS